MNGMEYTITVIDLDGSKTVKKFDNEDDFGFEYAEYCGCGYDGREHGNYAVVREVRA